MKLNKLLLVVFVLGFVLMAVPAKVYADESNSTSTTNDEETEEIELEDIALGNTNHGMEVRLLQLYKSITRNLDHGNAILSEIDAQNMTVDTNDLENTIDDLQDLSDKIKAELEETPVNVSTEEFVSLKSESINLTFQFKKELYDTFTPEQLYAIKSALKDDFSKNSEKVDEIQNRIREKARLHNQEQAMKMYNKFGMNNSALKEMIESGNFTYKDLKDDLKENFKEMKKEQRENAKNKIKEEQQKNMEKYQEAKTKMNANRIGLNETAVKEIINDDSLTWEEKQAKIRILAQETKQEHQAQREALNMSGKGPQGKGPEGKPEWKGPGNPEKENRPEQRNGQEDEMPELESDE